MKFLIGLLLIIGGAVTVSLVAGAGNGYVLLVQPPYRVELSLNMMLVLMALAFITFYALLHLFFYTLQLPEKVRNFKAEQRRKQGYALLLESLHALVEGRYGKAEKTASRALELGEHPELSALVAARAAHKLRNFTKRDFYLAEAERLTPEFEVGRLLAQAEMQLDEPNYGQALAALQRLSRVESMHIPALRLELKVQRQLGNWDQVLLLVLQLEKRDAIPPLQAQIIKRHAHEAQFSRLKRDPEALRNYWKKVPEDDRLDNRLALLAAQAFIAAGDGTSAARTVEMSLTKHWDSELAAIYGQCEGADPLKQLQQAEYWLLQHHHDAGLLLSLGHLCLGQELWGKASNYLEASLSIAPSSAAHLALARLAEHLNEADVANRHYRESLELALKGN